MQPLLNACIFGPVFLAGIVIDERSLIPVGSVCAIMGGVWWLGRKLQNIDDRLDNLPCHRHQPCEPRKDSQYGKSPTAD